MSITIQATNAFINIDYTPGLTVGQVLAQHLGCNPADVIGCLNSNGQVARVNGVEVSNDTVGNTLGDGTVIGVFSQKVNNGGVKGA